MGKRRSERAAEPVEAELPLGKYLASTEKRVRDRAIRSLSAFLLKNAQESGLSLPPTELAKLWKGIFYCFWMSDKPLVQQQLAQELAHLVLMVSGIQDDDESQAKPAASPLDDTTRALSALDFYQGFWTTMQAEWHGVDKFRVDKYYMLMRRFLFASFRLLLLNNCEDVLIKRFVQIMRGTDGPLSSNNVQVPDSLTYHVCDIYLDELERAASQLDPVPAIPVLDLLTPFMDLAATSRSKRIYERVMTSVLTPFLDACAARIPSSEQPRKRRKVHQDAATDVDLAYPHVLAHSTLETPAHGAHATDRLTPATSEDPAALYRTLKQEALRRIVAAASSPDTYVPSRRKLYALWSESQETEDDE